MSDHAEILARVQAAIAESLAVDLAEVAPSKGFFTEIGGEKIEWLDLSFRLDKQFGIRIPGMNFPGAATDVEGRFTPAGMTALRAILPASLLDRVERQGRFPTGKELAAEITVDDIAGMVELAIEAKNAVQSR
jgi:acyl carrier protein